MLGSGVRVAVVWLGIVAMTMTMSFVHAAPRRAPVDTTKETAKAAFTAGTRHYQLSEYPQALEKFKDAFRIFPDPSFLYNIGQCQRQLDQKEDAIRSYKSFLRSAGDTPMRQEVLATVAKLELAIAQERARAAEAEAERTKREAAERALAANVNAQLTVAAEHRVTPIYKRAWFWGVIAGAVVVVAIGVGLGVGLTTVKVEYPNANAPNGTIRF